MDRRAAGILAAGLGLVLAGCPGSEPQSVRVSNPPQRVEVDVQEEKGTPETDLLRDRQRTPQIDLQRDRHRTPRIDTDAPHPCAPEAPIIILEEEVEVTREIPKGTDQTNLSNKNLDSSSVIDAYGVGGGAAGAYGQRWGKGSLVVAGGSAGPPPPENRFKAAAGEDLRSTFSIDVDTASYANVRRFLKRRHLPPANTVRVEELINYFPYDYAPPTGRHPFATHVEVADCPWSQGDRLVRIGLKGRTIEAGQRAPSNLVFLVDVSGSMNASGKLGLLKRSLKLLVERLGESDRVALVAYAGASGLVLDSTSCNDRAKILMAIENLRASGSTNGGAGIQLAYETAIQNFVEGGINRVVLATDGDWNVGITRRDDLEGFISKKAKSGVFLSVLGFGMPSGDRRMETLADKGNGNYASIDTLREARKALVEQMNGTLVTIAKDVKIQVEFDEQQVASYRLVGYENRVLANKDFSDDTKDAGEIGAGHTVTALYQVVLKKGAQAKGRLLTLRLRYKQPDGEASTPLEHVVHDRTRSFEDASGEFRFATSVAAFGLLLRNSPNKGGATWAGVQAWAQRSLGDDPGGYRREFLDLVQRARTLVGDDAQEQKQSSSGAKHDDRG